jgi:uncharacterized protein
MSPDTPQSIPHTASRQRLAWARSKPVVGMVHLLPLPGAPGWTGHLDAVLRRAQDDARHLAGGGLDGLLVENFLDAPFHPDAVPPETVAALTRAVLHVKEAAPGLPVGVNVLRNDARSALAVAAATGAAFVRVNVHTGTMWADQGPLIGRAHETLRTRAALRLDCAIWADVHVKHAMPPAGATVEEAAQDAWDRGLADTLVVSGIRTGQATDPARIRAVRRAVPDAEVWVGSGATADNVAALFEVADGLIVGSALQRGGRAGAGVEAARVSHFMEAVDRARGAA